MVGLFFVILQSYTFYFWTFWLHRHNVVFQTYIPAQSAFDYVFTGVFLHLTKILRVQ